jgi:hypothetical protein
MPAEPIGIVANREDCDISIARREQPYRTQCHRLNGTIDPLVEGGITSKGITTLRDQKKPRTS